VVVDVVDSCNDVFHVSAKLSQRNLKSYVSCVRYHCDAHATYVDWQRLRHVDEELLDARHVVRVQAATRSHDKYHLSCIDTAGRYYTHTHTHTIIIIIIITIISISISSSVMTSRQ